MPIPEMTGVAHVKIPVSDLSRSRSWYESVLGLHVRQEFEDDDGTVRGVSGTLHDSTGSIILTIALRQNRDLATSMDGFDPLALTVAHREDLQTWADHLIGLGLQQPTINDGPANAVLFLNDPDNIQIRVFGPTKLG